MSDHKGLIIIGGGITGLSAGLAWSKNVDIENNPVTIIEKQPVVGGYVTSYKRKGFLFDTTQIIPDINDMLEYLDVQIDLKRYQGYYARIFIANPKTGEVQQYKIPSSLQGFEYYLTNRFYKDSTQIKKFFKISKKIYDELFVIKLNPTFFEKINMLFRCRLTIKTANMTFKEFYESFRIKSPEVREIFNVFAAFSGMPAERVAAQLTIGAMLATLEGAYRPLEGFIQFPQQLKKKFLDSGGKLLTNTRVEKIEIENGKVKGVILEGGEMLSAEYVITTIDAKVAMKELVGLEQLNKLNKKYATKVETMKMSASSLHIGLGLDDDIDLESLGFDCGYNVLTTGGDTFEKLFEAFDLDKTSISAGLFHCGVIVPSLTTNKKNTVIIRIVPIPASQWIKTRKGNQWLYEKEKNDLADFFIDIVEKYLIPDLRKHIVVRDIATPATFARYSGSPTGSNYDMAPFPNNFGKNRLSMVTPVKNLFQPKFSNGIWPCMQAGLQVVDYILKGKIMNGYSRFRKEIVNK